MTTEQQVKKFIKEIKKKKLVYYNINEDTLEVYLLQDFIDLLFIQENVYGKCNPYIILGPL